MVISCTQTGGGMHKAGLSASHTHTVLFCIYTTDKNRWNKHNLLETSVFLEWAGTYRTKDSEVTMFCFWFGC